jgi:hypothetical protein
MMPSSRTVRLKLIKIKNIFKVVGVPLISNP